MPEDEAAASTALATHAAVRLGATRLALTTLRRRIRPPPGLHPGTAAAVAALEGEETLGTFTPLCILA